MHPLWSPVHTEPAHRGWMAVLSSLPSPEGLACLGWRGAWPISVMSLSRDLGKEWVGGGLLGFQLLSPLFKNKAPSGSYCKPFTTRCLWKGTYQFKTLFTYQILTLLKIFLKGTSQLIKMSYSSLMADACLMPDLICPKCINELSRSKRTTCFHTNSTFKLNPLPWVLLLCWGWHSLMEQDLTATVCYGLTLNIK